MSTLDPRRSGRRLLRLAMLLVLAIAFVPQTVLAQDDIGVTSGVNTITGEALLDEDLQQGFSQTFALLMDATFLLDAEGTPLPYESQISTGLVIDGENASFEMALPMAPKGQPFDVVTGETGDEYPQVYFVSMVANIAGGPLLDPIDFLYGPAIFHQSLFVGEGDNIDGRMVVFADREGIEFPSEAGDDGSPLTGDDPTRELRPGWTVVDFSSERYRFIRSESVEVPFPEGDLGPIDYSGLGWTEAFDALVDDLSWQYPFYELKDVDLDALVETYRPLVEQAEEAEDGEAYRLAIYRFAREFHDGHVSSSRPPEWTDENYLGGFGFQVGQADDGTVWVISVAEDGPAAAEGIAVGDEVTAWNGTPIGEAIDETRLMRGSSSEHEAEQNRARLLTRGPVGSEVVVSIDDVDGQARDVELTAVEDRSGMTEAMNTQDGPDRAAQPIITEVLPSGVGYLRITGFYTNVTTFTEAWEQAFLTFDGLEVDRLIIDVRGNGGGYGLLSQFAASTFNQEPFTWADIYVPDAPGEEFVYGNETIIEVSPTQFEGEVVVLINSGCYSACESFSSAMGEIDSDRITIVGDRPTAGVYASVESWSLPDDVRFNASSTYAEVDGEIYLEGVGYPPDVLVPITGESLTSPEDEVLQAGEAILLDGADEVPVEGTPEAEPEPED
ncbi:MAG TPA: S41 family peptidase [Thermomicrobiales bacterium]|nr:S41 family peptidase [Thermomicrobiales bacterium]